MMFDLWPVYSGERFRASWPSCIIFGTFSKITFSFCKVDLMKFVTWFCMEISGNYCILMVF